MEKRNLLLSWLSSFPGLALQQFGPRLFTLCEVRSQWRARAARFHLDLVSADSRIVNTGRGDSAPGTLLGRIDPTRAGVQTHLRSDTSAQIPNSAEVRPAPPPRAPNKVTRRHWPGRTLVASPHHAMKIGLASNPGLR